ncbi:hypothetical protein A359_07230 [secondary endosymbiont of Ctenarytaina eucalypti]|uniref:Uncharacterized protein n=1 Tax=secondary endosymbiont of Ctenarytaina eucalypti TaxID=1199245 RepID=J3VT07_9ENTR|nr:hypothetical protein A359_07230 [secondary endosymbiont of Ctenarytaina eucalypti]
MLLSGQETGLMLLFAMCGTLSTNSIKERTSHRVGNLLAIDPAQHSSQES